FAGAAAAQAGPRTADRGPSRRRAGEGADDRLRLRTAAGRRWQAGAGGTAARRTAGPARPRCDARVQCVLWLGGRARSLGSCSDWPGTEAGPVSASGEARAQLLVVGSVAAALLLVGAYLAAGGSSYEPAKTQDPCEH